MAVPVRRTRRRPAEPLTFGPFTVWPVRSGGQVVGWRFLEAGAKPAEVDALAGACDCREAARRGRCPHLSAAAAFTALGLLEGPEHDR